MVKILERVNDRGKSMKCVLCRRKRAEFEYTWGVINEKIPEFVLCESCARMVGSNVVKDIIFKKTKVMPGGDRNEFIDLLIDGYNSKFPDILYNWNIETINKLVKNRTEEDETLEYKSEIPKQNGHKRNVQNTACAFSNTNGGFMIFGIEEIREDKILKELKLVGIKNEIDLRNRIYGIFSNFQPEINPGIKVIKINDNSCILVVRFEKSNEVIRAPDDRYYKRVQSRKVIINDLELKERIRKSS